MWKMDARTTAAAERSSEELCGGKVLFHRLEDESQAHRPERQETFRIKEEEDSPYIKLEGEEFLHIKAEEEEFVHMKEEEHFFTVGNSHIEEQHQHQPLKKKEEDPPYVTEEADITKLTAVRKSHDHEWQEPESHGIKEEVELPQIKQEEPEPPQQQQREMQLPIIKEEEEKAYIYKDLSEVSRGPLSSSRPSTGFLADNLIAPLSEGTGSEDSLHLDASSESLEEFEENSPGPWMPEEEEDDDEERKMEDEDDGGGESEEEEGCGDEHHVEADNENDGDQGGDHNEWLSKNQKILWSPNHEVARPYVPPPIPTPGPTLYAVARISSPETAFDLFFNEGIIQRILDMTNLQGRRSVNSWNTLTVEELRTYLGLLILAGIYKAKHEPTISLWDKESGRPIFSKTMAHGRFCQINRTISFDDRLLRPQRHHQNKMSPISDIWNMWNALLPKMYNLGREICIDEQLVSFSGRCSFRQYMPSKPAKYGLKIWTLCDVRTSYAWSMQMYTGKPPGGQREQDQEMRVVLDLCSPLEGHILTTDNFFTSFPLAAELKKKKMALVGTIRKNKAELPPHLVKVTGREVLSSLFAFSKDHTLVSYVPKKEKNFLILSTRHTEPEVMKTGKKKPKVIHDYNKTKGAVDHLDQACATYSCRRRAVSWPLCVFFHMVDISSYNAFVLFTEIYPDWNMKKSYKRRLFLEELGKALIRPEVLKREAPPSAEGLVEQAEQRPGPPSKRKQCSLCTKPLRASNICAKCGTYICRNHMKTHCMKC
ncbi:piggyBac transposable element-derived protein 4-like isoform X1 [Corythoichthys intestinalis]|uniref:piggyBac transposable element-derived protein 4-like isoform X1 n=1 Tax=Corythoichthys intestinalis TaxID=161448 RepID=UPI0025A581BD|nr:piggyBac transposable element-derived protein 4-like isoform X1 [Corythoichthys intestinalis]